MNYDLLKPMLAAGKPRAWTDEQLLEHFESLLPLIATPKIDGIRCICKPDGFPLTRSLKDIPNGSIRAYFFANREYIKLCFDGELTVGDSFQASTSGIMSHGGDPDFTYWIFDVPSDKPYKERVDEYSELELPIRFKTVPTVWIKSMEDLISFEAEALKAGYEGIMLRTPDSPYKFGRSTIKQAWLMKLKRFQTAEAKVIGFEPLQTNENPAEINELGYQERSTKKEGMRVQNTLGKFNVVGINNGFEGVEFSIGSGLCQAQRDTFWESQPLLMGKIIEYKYQPHGTLNAPRTPIFLKFRDAAEFSDTTEEELVAKATKQMDMFDGN